MSTAENTVYLAVYFVLYVYVEWWTRDHIVFLFSRQCEEISHVYCLKGLEGSRLSVPIL